MGVKTRWDTKILEKSIETMKTGDITADSGNLSMSKMSTPRPGLRPKKMTKFDGNKILQPMLMKAAQRRAEVITLDDSMEEKKAKTKSNDVSIEFIRVIDRKAEKRRKQVEEITKKKRKSLEQIPKDVKTLTKVARRVKRGQRVGEPKKQQNNQGFRFNPTSEPALNFGRQVPLSLRAKRPIVIDGSNVAMDHGKQIHNKEWFSVKGIEIAINYFKDRGHTNIKVFIPRYRLHENDNRELMQHLLKENYLILTNSRILPNGERISSYDDRIMVETAKLSNAVVLSNDQYRDLLNESRGNDEVIAYRLLPFNFVNDLFICPKDPLEKKGPHLDEFLCF